jgi:hypothetical protein
MFDIAPQQTPVRGAALGTPHAPPIHLTLDSSDPTRAAGVSSESLNRKGPKALSS